MSIFNNSKIKKSISVLLASVSLGGVAGCKKIDEEQERFISNTNIENKIKDNINVETIKLDDYEVDLLEHIETENNYIDETIKDELEDIEERAVEELEIIETKTDNDFKKAITGRTERNRLQDVLAEKDWGIEEEETLIYMYDRIDECYNVRDYDQTKKQNYLKNLVDTIEGISVVKINPHDDLLLQNNWAARADYVDNSMIFKFGKTAVTDWRHELAHMEYGTFLSGSNGNDLAYVCEEGRASDKEGDAMIDVSLVNSFDVDVDMSDDSFVIYGTNGTYPAFEEVYRKFVNLGVNMENLRKECIYALDLPIRIKGELTQKYGSELAVEYMNIIDAYLDFFNSDGTLAVRQNEYGQDIADVKANMETTYEKCMMKAVEMQYGKNTMSMER